MKAQNITIDINKLTVEELEVLNKIHFNYHFNDLKGAKMIQERIAFLNGWMSPKKEKEYLEKNC